VSAAIPENKVFSVKVAFRLTSSLLLERNSGGREEKDKHKARWFRIVVQTKHLGR